ncbi:MAG TPA: amidophosphoribosyltransferase, partial [Treponemataceae bacterium]|nr:amidophosphoribosyltransferase [Treponemataceae bacterium]
MNTHSECATETKLREKCGVIGIYLTDHEMNASRLAYYGLQSLQHRGQESTGIAVSDGERLDQIRELGLVADVYNNDNLAALKGYIAIGYVLYSTSGKATIENAQPFVSRSKLGNVAIAHNGSLVNAEP